MTRKRDFMRFGSLKLKSLLFPEAAKSQVVFDSVFKDTWLVMSKPWTPIIQLLDLLYDGKFLDFRRKSRTA